MRRRHKYDLYILIFIAVFTIGYFIYTNTSAGSKGVETYSAALKYYKNNDFEQAFIEYGRIPHNSNLKQAALFRQARCATTLGKKELAIKKYKKIVNSNSKTSIVPISEYNLAILMYELKLIGHQLFLVRSTIKRRLKMNSELDVYLQIYVYA